MNSTITVDGTDAALAQVAIEDVWGIGPKYARFLRNYGVTTARDLRDADERWIRKHLTVVGARIQTELHGTPCIPLEIKRAPKQQIMCARSFGKEVETEEEMQEAVSTYIARGREVARARVALQAHQRVSPHQRFR